MFLVKQVHARKKPMAEDVDYMAVASMTDGMVGAELANIIEVAAINMMRDGRPEVCCLCCIGISRLNTIVDQQVHQKVVIDINKLHCVIMRVFIFNL